MLVAGPAREAFDVGSAPVLLLALEATAFRIGGRR